MPELARFQDAFAAALAERTTAPIAGWLPDSAAELPGLAVYRNTIAKGCVDALAANLPTVARLVGDEWFTAAAALFARDSPPSSAALLAYGEAFPAWLEAFPPAGELPYLPAVAWMDWRWTTALFAPEAEPLAAEAFALAPEALAAARPRLHPSLAFAWFDDGTPSLWLAAREPDADDLELSPEPQGVLIVRPHDAVTARVLDRAGHAFLAAAHDGASLGEAIITAAEADPTTDLATLFAALIADGVFSGLDLGDSA
ncbi:MAG: putative DNA-binding domain-containing protein [Caulobacter sp.]|nr:putative DNA-binding domain-containing protein [Caulobacter sp.]